MTKLRNRLQNLTRTAHEILAGSHYAESPIQGGAARMDARGGRQAPEISAEWSVRTRPEILREQGFTLIEMMIVVAIIGLIMGMVGLNVMKKFDQARVDTTKNQMRNLGMILDDYKRVCGRYPTEQQGLDALIKKENAPDCKNWEEFIKGGKLPQDAWGHDFTYTSDGNKYEMKSLGADGKDGGEGTDKDLSSNDM